MNVKKSYFPYRIQKLRQDNQFKLKTKSPPVKQGENLIILGYFTFNGTGEVLRIEGILNLACTLIDWLIDWY